MFREKIAQGGPVAILVYTQPCDQMTDDQMSRGWGMKMWSLIWGRLTHPWGRY